MAEVSLSDFYLLGDLHVYDIAARAWNDLSYTATGIPPTPRAGHGFMEMDGLLYVHGGYGYIGEEGWGRAIATVCDGGGSDAWNECTHTCEHFSFLCFSVHIEVGVAQSYISESECIGSIKDLNHFFYQSIATPMCILYFPTPHFPFLAHTGFVAN